MLKSMMLAVALAFSAAACSPQPGSNPATDVANTPVNMQDPAKAVFALKSAYAGVLTVAVAYNKRPRCSATSGPLCSDPNLIAQIRAADNVANSAINTAESAVRSLGTQTTAIKAAVAAAQAAVDAFTAVVPRG